MNSFKNITDKSINTSLGLNQLQQKGSLVYEYNPLRVFRVSKDITDEDGQLLYPKGSIINLDTDLLNFDLNHPVDIVPQASYDGSVNLIINDGKNYPKLVNSRFSPTGMDTYQIVDREGDNDTNIYDDETFESDISLYKKINNIINLNFVGLGADGNLKVGNYVFYFRLSDSDNNETDFIAESGIVTCHIGNLNDPASIQGGIRNENSFKSVNFVLSDIDSSYNHVNVYYTRSTSDIDQNEITESYKILKGYPIYNGTAKVVINGFEQTESVSINDINVQYNIVDNALTQASCQNMLFLGNVHKPDIPYLELSDLSLRLKLQLNASSENNIGFVNERYQDASGKYEYYNANNIYYKLGYWNNEIYRFGIVYILNDYTLSPVFNLRGTRELTTSTTYSNYDLYLEDGSRNYISYNKETFALDNLNENAKGVFRIRYKGNQLASSGVIPLGLDLQIPEEVKIELKKYTKGFFLVRQKRIPTILCQAVLIGLDNTSHLPVIPVQGDNYIIERFFDNDRLLTHDFGRRVVKIGSDKINIGSAALCPEFELQQAYFNQLFTSSQFPIKIASRYVNKYFNQSNNYFYNLNSNIDESSDYQTATITSVGDNVKTIKGKNIIFSARAGEAEEAWRMSNYEFPNKASDATNIVRGAFGPYLGIEGIDNTDLSIINIHIPNYDEYLLDSYFSIRYEDSSAFYAIQDRISWDKVTDKVSNIFRGDCFIGNYTHRMVRNFQDPSAPINDDIIDEATWKDNYDVENEEKYAKINRGDVNAVKLGHWVTVKLCSSVNLAMRCLDYSYPSEEGLTGKPRGFYPLQSRSTTGESKIPESFVINGGNSSTTSDKYNFEQPKVPAIKNIFNTRIMYSDLNVNDAFKNGFRTYKLTNYRDYPSTYGSLIRILEWYGNLIAVFEHGVALIPINERALSGEGAGGSVFINTSNVLPENPKILSDTFGTQWGESVIKTPYYVYGVDTVGKKIWRTNGQIFETISDFKVQKFLNDNISLTEVEKTPIIGLRNVKSHYNKFKQDVMFTFYDDINTLEENVWNLCYNEVMQKFITFYSWVPSYSENIDNIFFSFDRDTSKTIVRLTSDYPSISIQEGSILSNKPEIINNKFKLGTLQLNIEIDNSSVEYGIADDRVRDRFYIEGNELFANENLINDNEWTIPVKAIVYNQGSDLVEGDVKNIVKTVYSNITIIINDSYSLLTASFWKHGQAGLMETKEPITPCYWYGKPHPFEFEFVMVDNPSTHKIFNNLQIISNKAQPESFHFEIVGEVYNFAKDKMNMYFRQEATKHLYQYNGGNILFDEKYLKLQPKQRDILYSTINCKDMSAMFPLYYSRVDSLNNIYDHYQSITSIGKDYQNLSGSEIVYDDLLNEFRIATHIKGCPFEGIYEQAITENYYKNQLSTNNQVYVTCIKEYPPEMSKEPEQIKARIDFWELDVHGEPIYSRTENGFMDQDRIKYSYVKYFMLATYGRINGNMNYQEDKWDVQIPSITYWAKNEMEWEIQDSKGNKYPPLNLVNNPLPEDMASLTLSSNEDIPKELLNLGYTASTKALDITTWGPDRKETKIRDKYIKVKIRYSGNELAIITALKTLYTISYA